MFRFKQISELKFTNVWLPVSSIIILTFWASFHDAGNNDDLHWVMSEWFLCITELLCIVIFLVQALSVFFWGRGGERVALVARLMFHTSGFFFSEAEKGGNCREWQVKIPPKYYHKPCRCKILSQSTRAKPRAKYRQLGMAFWVSGPGHFKDVDRCAK